MPPMWWKLVKIMLLLFALFTTTTTADDAPFMPIPSMLGDQPAPSPADPAKPQPQHYHQYHSLNHQEQTFKVQRSPDGKLNLVFNDPLVSLQRTQQQEQPQQLPKPRKPTSDKRNRPLATPAPTMDTGEYRCVDGFNQSRSFCTKVDNYPDLSGLKAVLSRKFANYFNEEPPPTEVGLRMNEDELQLCHSQVRYLYPKLGQRVGDLTWQYIVNTDEFKQGILIEECENEGETCAFLDSFPQNYSPVCKQHYVIRHLATINNGSAGQPEVANDAFKIPSCCKCVIKPKAQG